MDDVSLALEPGELTFLVGPSGAGKSTLLKLINRELRPSHGEVWVDGIATHKLKPSRISELRRRVGVVFQNYKLLPRLTALAIAAPPFPTSFPADSSSALLWRGRWSPSPHS